MRNDEGFRRSVVGSSVSLDSPVFALSRFAIIPKEIKPRLRSRPASLARAVNGSLK